mmetsp:Transcript_27692/g.65006  ORF Transcript_27692/g.65006 Transcript_27692/m.65006 type:complete len:139 (-) Transcript_27692:512-928(-)
MESLFSCLFVQSFLVSINRGWAATEQLEALFRPVHPQLCVRSTLLDLSLHSIAFDCMERTKRNGTKQQKKPMRDATVPSRTLSKKHNARQETPASQPTNQPARFCVASPSDARVQYVRYRAGSSVPWVLSMARRNDKH